MFTTQRFVSYASGCLRHPRIWGLAAMAGLLICGRALAAEIPSQQEPDRLPEMLQAVAAPLRNTADSQGIDVIEAINPHDVPMRLWFVLREHREARFDSAADQWRSLHLPAESEVWRQLALVHIHLSRADLAQAGAVLDEALKSDPENAVVHYFLGVLRLMEASRAGEWRDAGEEEHVAFAALTPVVPNTRRMYEQAAIQELELTVTLASTWELEQPLVPADWPTNAAVLPTVRDLLEAIGADRFDGKAHHMLSYLYLDRERLEHAEEHLDAAVRAGIQILFGYSDLGKKYVDGNRPRDATRAYAKAIIHSPATALPAKKMIESLRDSLLEVP
jgi:tetratricopeptide (TPR) repeat protein